MDHRSTVLLGVSEASLENAPQFSATQGAGELWCLNTNSISHWLKAATEGVCWNGEWAHSPALLASSGAKETHTDLGSGKPTSAHCIDDVGGGSDSSRHTT